MEEKRQPFSPSSFLLPHSHRHRRRLTSSNALPSIDRGRRRRAADAPDAPLVQERSHHIIGAFALPARREGLKVQLHLAENEPDGQGERASLAKINLISYPPG